MTLWALSLTSRCLAQPSTLDAPDEFFKDPAGLCAALEADGIHAGPWKRLGSGFFDSEIEPAVHAPFACEYPIWVKPPQTGLPPSRPPGSEVGRSVPDTSLIFRVSGDSGQRADLISIAVTVHQASALATGKEELHRHVAQLFNLIHRRVPAGLYASIESQQHFRSRQPYGIVWFNLVKPDHHNLTDQTLWFRLYQ
jgi:hypothetical protein